MNFAEIIAREQQTGHLCLTLRGMFYTAYNGSAQALARIAGYKVKRTAGGRNSDSGCYAGFPAPSLEKVLAMLEKAGGRVVVREEKYLEIEGIAVSFDAGMLEGYQVRGRSKSANPPAAVAPLPGQELVSRILGYDLGTHTPLEAMLFLRELQTGLQRQSAGANVILQN